MMSLELSSEDIPRLSQVPRQFPSQESVGIPVAIDDDRPAQP